MLSVDEATAHILNIISGLVTNKTEIVEIANAQGRVLASDVCAGRDQPPADSSAMDGYAVRFADQENAPTTLKLIGEAQAGSMFEGVVESGQAVRIFTGGIVPKGADTIVMQENTSSPETDKEADNEIIINQASHLGRHIRYLGHDFSQGLTLLKKGKRLNSRDIALAAAGNVAKVSTYKKPVVALLSTGDELVAAGQANAINQIVNSNSPMLANLIDIAGGRAVILDVVGDQENALKSAIENGAISNPDIDILVTIGGASVGNYDLVQGVLKELGFNLGFWKVAMRPGKPIIFGTLPRPNQSNKSTITVLGLPGNPVSSIVGAYLFLLPIIDSFLNTTQGLLTYSKAKLSENLSENGARQAYLRASINLDKNGQLTTRVNEDQDSAALLSLSQSQGFIIRPANAPPAAINQLVDVLILGNLAIY
jgi:molybdopterin molybdotransferase